MDQHTVQHQCSSHKRSSHEYHQRGQHHGHAEVHGSVHKHGTHERGLGHSHHSHHYHSQHHGQRHTHDHSMDTETSHSSPGTHRLSQEGRTYGEGGAEVPRWQPAEVMWDRGGSTDSPRTRPKYGHAGADKADYPYGQPPQHDKQLQEKKSQEAEVWALTPAGSADPWPAVHPSTEPMITSGPSPVIAAAPGRQEHQGPAMRLDPAAAALLQAMPAAGPGEVLTTAGPLPLCSVLPRPGSERAMGVDVVHPGLLSATRPVRVDPHPFTYPPPDVPLALPDDSPDPVLTHGSVSHATAMAHGPMYSHMHMHGGQMQISAMELTAESRPHADAVLSQPGSVLQIQHADGLSMLYDAATSPRANHIAGQAFCIDGIGIQGNLHEAAAGQGRPLGLLGPNEPEAEEGHVDIVRIPRQDTKHAPVLHSAGSAGIAAGSMDDTHGIGAGDMSGGDGEIGSDTVMAFEPVPVQDLAGSVLSEFDRTHGYQEPPAVHAHVAEVHGVDAISPMQQRTACSTMQAASVHAADPTAATAASAGSAEMHSRMDRMHAYGAESSSSSSSHDQSSSESSDLRLTQQLTQQRCRHGAATAAATALQAAPPHAYGRPSNKHAAAAAKAEDAAWAAEAALALLLLGSPPESSAGVPQYQVSSPMSAAAPQAGTAAAHELGADSAAVTGAAAAAVVSDTATQDPQEPQQEEGEATAALGPEERHKLAMHGMVPSPSVPRPIYHKPTARKSIGGTAESAHEYGGTDAREGEVATSGLLGASWPGPILAGSKKVGGVLSPFTPYQAPSPCSPLHGPGAECAIASFGYTGHFLSQGDSQHAPSCTAHGQPFKSGHDLAHGSATNAPHLAVAGSGSTAVLKEAHSSPAAAAVQLPGAHGAQSNIVSMHAPVHLGPVSTAGSRPGPFSREACDSINGGAVVALGTAGFGDTRVGMSGVDFDSAANELGEEDRDMAY